MFRRLQTKLSILYGALFGVLLTLVVGAAYLAIVGNAERAIRSELQASGTVFDRIWALRSQQLHDSASLLAHDFGFRSAVATQDKATTQSALDNLRSRLRLDRAFIVRLDGTMSGMDPAQVDDGSDKLWNVLNEQDDAAGVLMIAGRPYEAISAPIMAPNLIGWVVFASRLDRTDLDALTRLSAVPLQAELIERDARGRWTLPEAAAPNPADLRRIQAFAARAAAARSPGRLDLSSGAAVALAKPLKTLRAGEQTALLLRYPLAAALAPYRPMLVAIGVLGAISFAALMLGSWLLARNVTQPISALDEAAHRLMRGEEAHVEIATADEVGRLAASFNRMATEIRERERHITHMALHDAETELPNRRALTQALEVMIAEPGPGVVVAAAFGVERFAIVRSAIGYGLVGALLGQLAARIVAHRAELRPARLTTGVLGVAFRATDLAEAEAMLLEVARAMGEPVRLGSTTVDVGLKVGVAACPEHAQTAAALLERANIALDQAYHGAGKLAVFDETAYGDPASNLSLMSEMLDAIGKGDLMVHHQPKLDLRSGRIIGAEALVRWRHPTRGMLPPDLFVGMAEETGHIRELSDWVLEQAIGDQAALKAAGRDLMISVNLSGRLVGDADYAAKAIRRIEAADARICFEITETAVIADPQKALELIDAYAAAGVPISIDDYGSGLSSLAYLKRISAQELKIDKAFILGLADGQRDGLLVKSTIDLAHALGMKVTAEGVETADILSILSLMGCDVAQGYHIAKPMPLEPLLAFLAEQDAAPGAGDVQPLPGRARLG
jgi:EAL domain-containing protein (putative c-di-GMP-specific phosphodiesterase class I)/GGDEF domain-containing protein